MRPSPERETPAPVELVGIEFGEFPAVTPLNPRFVQGAWRARLTLEVNLTPPGDGPVPPEVVERLQELLPTLRRHRCCGDNQMSQTFFRRGPRRDCAMQETGDAVDVAHLLEHLVIDFQHFIGRMRICSGITCGYETPRNRYDIFVESPGEEISRLSVHLAQGLLNDVLAGAAPDPAYAAAMRLARRFVESAGAPVAPDAAAREPDEGGSLPRALDMLRDVGFISEIETCVNFSRMPIFRLSACGDDPGQTLT